MKYCRLRYSIPLCLWCLALATLLQWRLIFRWHERTAFRDEFEDAANKIPNARTLTSASRIPFHRNVKFPIIPRTPISWVVFYHIYIPAHSTDKAAKALSIVKEQLDQIRNSHAAKQNSAKNNTLILYTTIGKRILPEIMNEMCQPELRCVNILSLGSGFEDKTLRKVHAYCMQQPNVTVTYIHNKGSHHNRQGANDFWRQHMTLAVTSRDCYEAVTQPFDDNLSSSSSSSSSCNACGLLFQTIPSLHFPGNFWTARCDYVQKLQPTASFYTKLDRTLNIMDGLTNNNQGILKRQLYNSREDWSTGRGRYAAEQWIASHPQIQPCDVSSTPDLRFWQSEQRSLADFEWHIVPRRNLLDKNWQIQPRPNQTILKDAVSRLQDYHLLPGLLARWWLLYETLPSFDSWVWRHFPDGEFWRDRIQKEVGSKAIHGSQIHELSNLLSLPQPPQEVLVDATTTTALASIHHSSAPWTFFYHVFLPSDKNVSHIIEEQLSTLEQSYAAQSLANQLTIHYSLVGDGNTTLLEQEEMDVVADICSRHEGLRCTLVQRLPQGNEDATLTQLYDFCLRNPEQSSVVYFHSKGSYHHSTENENWRRHLLAAVSGKDCLESIATPLSSNATEACDVCGLQFYPLWAFFFPGNFFAGRCSYIRQLLRPSDFGNGMRTVVDELMDRKKRNLLRTDLYSPNREGNLGLDRYSWEQWVASHPSIRPCDLSRTANFRHWVHPQPDSNLLWSMAPRHDVLAPWYRIQTGKRDLILADTSRRMREYFLLAGMHLKWFHLYNMTPSSDSWVYRWFPDGQVWRDGVEAYGSKVVDVLTERYSAPAETEGNLTNTTLSLSLLA